MGGQIRVCSAGEIDWSGIELVYRPLARSILAARLVAVSQSSTRTASKKLQTIEGTLLVTVEAYSRSWFCLAVAKRARSRSTARAEGEQARRPRVEARRAWGRIPKGFRPKAQGCEERATLGNRI